MAESTQHKLDRVRPPRVQITYDVEIGNATEMKELPFVVGVLSDLSGMLENPLPKLKDRKFVEIDRDNFDEIMASIRPRLHLTVPNCIAGDDSEMAADLIFQGINDFNPLEITKQIPALALLYEARSLLKDLMTKLDGNDVLDHLLQDIVDSTDKRKAISDELGAAPSTPEA